MTISGVASGPPGFILPKSGLGDPAPTQALKLTEAMIRKRKQFPAIESFGKLGGRVPRTTMEPSDTAKKSQ